MDKKQGFDLLCNPYTGNGLQYREENGKEYFVDVLTKEEFPFIQNGIPAFIGASDITSSNAGSAKFYNSFSPFYELGQKLWYSFFGGEEKARNDYLKFLNIHEGDRVLEVSVGTGANIRFLPRGAEYYGLDISVGQLMQSVKNKEKYGLELQLFWGNAEYLPFKDESFDDVYHVGGINFFSDRQRAIDEMIRVAKKSTKFLIADETEKVAKIYEKIPYFRGPFKNRKGVITAPVELLPANVSDVKVTEIRGGTLYCLEFVKNR